MNFSASWIKSPKDSGAAAYTYQKKFKPTKTVAGATLYVSAMGVYVPWLNGVRV